MSGKLYDVIMWLHSIVFEGTSNKHWNTDRTTSIISKNSFIEMVSQVSNEARPYLFGVWPQKIIRIQCKLYDSHFSIQVTRSTKKFLSLAIILKPKFLKV